MKNHVFVGFGFGPIQSGLFVAEAYKSGNFSRIVVAEVDSRLVEAIGQSNGSYHVNIATNSGIEILKVQGVEIYNPTNPEDLKHLKDALAQSTEITTALPSVDFYTKGSPSVASLIAEAIKNSTSAAKIIYTGENNNHAAEVFERDVEDIGVTKPQNVQFLNTVIGKMSRIVTDPDEVNQLGLAPITDKLQRAFLVEEFNRIMVTRSTIEGFEPGIQTFAQKADLLPFEEAKLYGHNAIHALLAYLGSLKGYNYMRDIKNDSELMEIAYKAFTEESGKALIKKYADLGDPLFTTEGYREFAQDLLERMTNPYLADTIDRAARDPLRKLSYSDRLIGTMRIALSQQIEPTNMALAAMAGIACLIQQAKAGLVKLDVPDVPWQKLTRDQIEQIAKVLWNGQMDSSAPKLIDMLYGQQNRLVKLIKN